MALVRFLHNEDQTILAAPLDSILQAFAVLPLALCLPLPLVHLPSTKTAQALRWARLDTEVRQALNGNLPQGVLVCLAGHLATRTIRLGKALTAKTPDVLRPANRMVPP
jgi:hypothetical protein